MAILDFSRLSRLNIDFFGMRSTTLAITLFMTLGTILGIMVGRLEYGIDFKGGNFIEIRHHSGIDISDLRGSVSAAKVGEVFVQEVGIDRKGALFKFAAQGNNESQNTDSVNRLKEFLNTKLPGVEHVKVDSVGPKVGEVLMRDGIAGVVLGMFAMFLYIWFRFEWKFGLAAIISLLHDCLGVLGYYVVTKADVNITAIVAVLMTAGYSINGTVVIFDRIRENIKYDGSLGVRDIINNSVNSTLSRNFLTSFSTLITVFIPYMCGGPILADYCMPIIVGFLTGAYSSICFAPIVLDYLKIDVKSMSAKYNSVN